MKIGVVGLPNVGKSTLFNAITKAGAESANYPFCTIEPNVGIVDVRDDRLKNLADLYNSKKIIPASTTFVDIAGLVAGASKGEGLGNKFLSHIREVDAICHVVRCFEDSKIVNVNAGVDPLRDIEIINIELILSDLETVTKRLEKQTKLVRIGDKSLEKENVVLQKIKTCLEDGKCARVLSFDKEEQQIANSFFLITTKPVIYCANIGEEDIGKENNQYVKAVEEFAKKEDSQTIVLCAKIEEELSQLEDDDKAMFMEELNITESGLDKLVVAGYKLLGLMSYITAGEQEVRAWTIKIGTKAPAAAGKIHTDFEKGFIKAEVIKYEDLMECKSIAAAKEKGKVRIEGKEYVVQDGDVILFRFNV